MKKFIYILTALFTLAACAGLRDADPYTGDLHTLTVATQWPSEDVDRSGAEVRVDEVNTGGRYVTETDEAGVAKFTLPDGLYRITLSGVSGKNVFNAAADRVVLSGKSQEATL